ncbi:MAG: hypothetical protein AAB818_00800 [Patescibacteria group bacterium]
MKTVSPRNNRNVSSKIIVKKWAWGMLVVWALLTAALIFGCSSAPKVYCPKGHSVPMDKINKSIRAINTCPAPTCGAQFSYLAEVEQPKTSIGDYFFGYRPYYQRSWRTTRYHWSGR